MVILTCFEQPGPQGSNYRAFTHPRRPRGSQSGREKRRDESFQVPAKEPLGTDSHRTIPKIQADAGFSLCPIGEQFLPSSFREFVHDGFFFLKT